MTKTTYTCCGSVRGSCGHRHRTNNAAAALARPVAMYLGDYLDGLPYMGACRCGRQHVSTHAIVHVVRKPGITIAYCSAECAARFAR